jgi:hypothetical protein
MAYSRAEQNLSFSMKCAFGHKERKRGTQTEEAAGVVGQRALEGLVSAAG